MRKDKLFDTVLDQLIAKERGINQEVVSQPQTAEKEVATNPENPTVPIQEQNTEAKTNTENDNTDLEQADKKQLLDQAVKKAVPIKVKTENKKETTDQQINAKKGVEKEKKQTESENKATPTSEQDTNVRRMALADINTDEGRFQGRKKLNETIVTNIAENFSDKDQDPIHVWQDPKDGKYYVLSGHHRYYGAKKAGRNDVKIIDRTNDFTEEQAIKFAKEEANANRSMETPLERANTLRDKRNRGDADIKEFLAKEGKNGRYVENLSYLNPKGKVMNMLNQLSETDDRATIKEMERIADWVGEVMKRFDGVLTKAHEDELYDFLMGEKSKRFTNKADFAENVRAIIDKLFFDNNQPLNLNRISNKGDGMRMWEEKRDKLKGELKAVTEKIDNLKARFTDPNHADYVSPDLENYANVVKRKDELLKNLEAERKAIEQKIIEHGRNRKKYLKGDVNTLSLFDVNAMYQKGNTPQRQRISDNTFWKFINKAKRFARGYFGDVKIFTDWNEFKTHANKLNGKDKVKQQKAQDTESLRLEKERIVSEAKANGTYMKAPNGQPTNLNEEQWVAVRTKAFKDWFGDWELGAKEVQIAQAKPHNFKNFAEAKAWAKENIARTYTNEETGGKGEIKISNTAIDKFFSKSAIEKSETKDAHLSTLKSLPEIIRNSIEAEQHADYLKGEDGIRRKENGINENVTIHRLFGAVNVGGETYRVKVTLKRDRTQKAGKNLYSYETTKIELLAGQNGDPVGTPRYSNNSITGANLLNGVEKSYEKGKFLLDHSKVVDQNGEPLVVYHGTNADFDVFDAAKASAGKFGKGFYFTQNKREAETYAYANAQGGSGRLVVEAFVNARNPFETKSVFSFQAQMASEGSDSASSSEHLLGKGHDGVVSRGREGVFNELVAFHPNQIKSATDNIGTYSEDSNDIRYHKKISTPEFVFEKFKRLDQDIITNETKEDEDLGTLRKKLVPKFVSSWYYADNTDPDIKEFTELKNATKDVFEEGNMSDNTSDIPYKTLSVTFDEVWIDEYDDEVDWGDEDVSYDDVYSVLPNEIKELPIGDYGMIHEETFKSNYEREQEEENSHIYDKDDVATKIRDFLKDRKHFKHEKAGYVGNSHYFTYETDSGKKMLIRVADHNFNHNNLVGKNFKNEDEIPDNVVSIVIQNKVDSQEVKRFESAKSLRRREFFETTEVEQYIYDIEDINNAGGVEEFAEYLIENIENVENGGFFRDDYGIEYQIIGENDLDKIQEILDTAHAEPMPKPIRTLVEFKKVFAEPVKTPINEVKVTEKVYRKIVEKDRQGLSGVVKPTLESPTFIIEDTDGSKLFVKVFNKGGKKNYNIVAVNKKGEVDGEILTSVHIKSNNNLKNKIKNGAELLLPSKRKSNYGDNAPSNSAPNMTNVAQNFENPKQNNNLQELRTPSGVVYGAKLSDGSLYFNPDKLNYDTAIHELLYKV